MTDMVNEFCERVHAQIEDLDGRMELLKLNFGTTWRSLREKLDEVRLAVEARRKDVTQARSDLAQWASERETEDTILRWIENRETEKLIARAQKAEDNAYVALTVVEASLNDAERMVLEAISAWRDAQAVTVELGGSEVLPAALPARIANEVGVSPVESRRF
jgi:hypothetical protein